MIKSLNLLLFFVIKIMVILIRPYLIGTFLRLTKIAKEIPLQAKRRSTRLQQGNLPR